MTEAPDELLAVIRQATADYSERDVMERALDAMDALDALLTAGGPLPSDWAAGIGRTAGGTDDAAPAGSWLSAEPRGRHHRREEAS